MTRKAARIHENELLWRGRGGRAMKFPRDLTGNRFWSPRGVFWRTMKGIGKTPIFKVELRRSAGRPS
jgi:hypothetical protein